MPCFQLLPIVEVNDRPVLASHHHLPELGAPPWWLLAATKRSVRVGNRHLRLLTTEGRVLGLAVGDHPIDEQRSVGRRKRLPRPVDRNEQTVLVMDGDVISATSPRFMAPSFARHVLTNPCETTVWGGYLVTWEAMSSGRPSWIVRLRPVRDLPEPLFSRITRAQMETALCAVTGSSSRAIAAQRGCGTETVRSHLRSIYRLLGCSSRVELNPMVDEWHAWTSMLFSREELSLVG